MIKTAIDTDLIGKYIGNELYKISLKHNISQTDIANKLGVRQGNISSYLTGKVTTKNIEQYWRIAEAVGLIRKDFDRIVEEAKKNVLGISDDQEITEDQAISFLAKEKGVTVNDIKTAIATVQALKQSRQ